MTDDQTSGRVPTPDRIPPEVKALQRELTNIERRVRFIETRLGILVHDFEKQENRDAS